jgi:hypothetical protein
MSPKDVFKVYFGGLFELFYLYGSCIRICISDLCSIISLVAQLRGCFFDRRDYEFIVTYNIVVFGLEV